MKIFQKYLSNYSYTRFPLTDFVQKAVLVIFIIKTSHIIVMNFLKLNNHKTEFIITELCHSKLQQYPTSNIRQPVECAQNIGVIFDNNMYLDRQVV